MNNPLTLDVSDLVRGGKSHEIIETSGPAPVHIGLEMIAIEKGENIDVRASITNVGEGLMVEADISGSATGQCARCLAPLNPELTFHVSELWALSTDFITTDENDDEDDDGEGNPPLVVDYMVDLTQQVIDEAGVSLPFSPTCEQFGGKCDESTPEPDGISGEEELIDPRWAALRDKFPVDTDTRDEKDTE